MNFAQILKCHYQGLFQTLLIRHAASERDWEKLLRCLKLLNLTEIVTPAPPFSKFPWVRHPVPLSRHLVASAAAAAATPAPTADAAPDAAAVRHVESSVAAIVENWVQLLVRECDTTSLHILLRQDADALDGTLQRLYISTATAKQVAKLMLHDLVAEVLDDHPFFKEQGHGR